MTEIDQTTGLPTLPDGQRWRVAKDRRNYVPCYVVFLERRVEKRVKETKLVRRRLILKDVYETVFETVTEWTTVGSEWLGDTEVNENGEIVTEEVTTYSYYSVGPPQTVRSVPKFTPAELSKEVILEAALKIVEDQRVVKAKQDLENRLLGEYPPKSLS